MRHANETRATARRIALALALLGLASCQHVAPAPLSAQSGADALEGRSLADPKLRRFLERETATTFESWPPAQFDLAQLTLAALFFQPSLDVARAQRDVARGGVVTAGQRPNPAIILAPEWSANPGTGISPWLALLHFEWPIETGHKREHRTARAVAVVDGAEHALAAQAWTIRRTLRTALSLAVASSERAKLLHERADAEQALATLLDARVQQGAASRADVLPARLAWLATEAERADAERSRDGARAQVAAAIGVPVSALEGIDFSYPLADDGAARDASAAAELRRRALHERADVLAALDAYAASEAALRLELAKQWPDVRLGGGYQFDEGQSKWGLTLALDLPVMNRNEGPIAEAVAARSEAAARFVALQAQVIAELDLAQAELQGARVRRERLEALVASQRSALDRARAARVAGAADRATELAAQIETLRGESLLLDARAALDQASSQLEAAVQGSLATPASIAESPRPLIAERAQ
jgi:outer membrane protein TolC